MLATALYAAVGGHPGQWFFPPIRPEHAAALVVFSLGEEFGWRGFAHARMVRRHGLVKGSLILGAGWGFWHLAYAVTPEAGFDPFVFAMMMIELPLYSLLIAWVFERANRSMAVAVAFHAGAHLDNFQRVPQGERTACAPHRYPGGLRRPRRALAREARATRAHAAEHHGVGDVLRA